MRTTILFIITLLCLSVMASADYVSAPGENFTATLGENKPINKGGSGGGGSSYRRIATLNNTNITNNSIPTLDNITIPALSSNNDVYENANITLEEDNQEDVCTTGCGIDNNITEEEPRIINKESTSLKWLNYFGGLLFVLLLFYLFYLYKKGKEKEEYYDDVDKFK